MKIPFYQVDVFTNSPLGGNPLAVFPDASGLDESLLLRIAREMNLSETVFLYPSDSESVDYRMRIFTPAKEIPFAGHPVIGTAYVICKTGMRVKSKNSVQLGLPAQTISVVSGNEDEYFMEQPEAQFGKTMNDLELIAKAVNLDSRLIGGVAEPQVCSTGLAALYVSIDGLKSIENIMINGQSLNALLDLSRVDMLYVFTLETQGASVHSRSFAPGIGIPEDPATGSAAGALSAYLAKNEVLDKETLKHFVIEQGYEINRPSQIIAGIEWESGSQMKIKVGGSSVLIIEGQMMI
ncbi:MAG: PhzF family phenazine biosynthesis protein [Candidatus Nitrohelix vancouverensis]|uniref:PhzF family phenazine biosynthesis protein n=1 Tax=Candidatus Nitrohelix vancouverensis TaxID=2705534 RepID=A0A7T0C3K5_9BACT|nr:MAG: PhzF family phenazine biosynthesis protein [Candidatus Nitrohelix vancouverensis]